MHIDLAFGLASAGFVGLGFSMPVSANYGMGLNHFFPEM